MDSAHILRGVPSPDLVKDVVEAMTTNETSFFRDTKPFDQFRDVIMPMMITKRRSVIAICVGSNDSRDYFERTLLLYLGRPARLLPEHERVADAALKALWARWVLKRANELNNAVLHGLYVNVRFAWYDRGFSDFPCFVDRELHRDLSRCKLWIEFLLRVVTLFGLRASLKNTRLDFRVRSSWFAFGRRGFYERRGGCRRGSGYG